MKRILAFIIAVLMTFSAFTAFAENETDMSSYQRYVSLANNLGITGGSAAADARVTRGELAVMITNMLNMTEIIGDYKKGGFFDLDQNRDDIASIETVYKLGIMTDVKDNKFRPDDNLTFPEACEAIVKLLGYMDMGKAKGYHVAAVSLGVMDGLRYSADEITMGELCMMIYNAMTVPMARYAYLPDNNMIDTGAATILGTYLKLYSGKGKITAVKGLNLYGNPKEEISENHVEINSVIYETVEYFTGDRIGNDIRFWYRINERERKEIIYAELDTEQSDLELVYSDIKSADTNGIEYYDQNGKIKKISFATGGIRVIKNAEPVASINDLSLDKKGTLRLVLDDRHCTAVVAWEYESYIVEGMTSTKIYLRYTENVGKTAGIYPADRTYRETLSLPREGIETEYVISGDDVYYDISDVAENDVLSIAYVEAADTFYIKLSRKKVSGMLEAVKTKAGSEYYKIEGKDYKLDRDFIYHRAEASNGIKDLKSGVSTDFYLDFMDEICGVSYTDAFQYGYVNGMTDEGEQGDAFTQDYVIRLISRRARAFDNYRLTKTVKTNGINMSRQAAYNALKTHIDNLDPNYPPIIKFKQNLKGDISTIVFDVNPYIESRVSPFETNENWLSMPLIRRPGTGTYDGYHWTDVYNRFAFQNVKNSSNESNIAGLADPSGNKKFDGYADTIRMDQNGYSTLALRVPDDGNEEDFEFGVPADVGVKGNQRHDVLFYDLNEFNEPALLVYFAPPGSNTMSVGELTNILVEEAATVLDKDGMPMLEIVGWYNGDKATYTAEEGIEGYSEAQKLEKGDFVQVSANYKNEITALAFVGTYNFEDFDFSRYEKPTEGVLGSGGDIYNRYLNSGSRKMFFNKVKDANSTFILFDGDKQTTACTFAIDYEYQSGHNMTLYDGKEFSKIQVRQIEKDDVVIGLYYGEGRITNIVVFRNVDLSEVQPYFFVQ